jgi:hypothetical protein
MKLSRRSTILVSLVALLLGGGLALSSALAASAASGGTLYVLQGLPGATTDVSVDGQSVGTAVAATSAVGPLRVAAGRHVIELTSKGTRLVRASVSVPAGASVDVLAYYAAETPAMPRLVALPNDLLPVGPGKTRLVVTHGIAGPPADILVNGKVLFRSVANGESVSVLVPAGTYSVKAVATIGGQTLLPSARLTLKAGTFTRAIAIGAPKGKPGVLVHALAVPMAGAGRPSAVHTGSGGQAAALFSGGVGGLAEQPRLPFALLSVAFLGLAVIFAASTRPAFWASRHAR